MVVCSPLPFAYFVHNSLTDFFMTPEMGSCFLVRSFYVTRVAVVARRVFWLPGPTKLLVHQFTL